MRSSRFDALDGLRGIAALAVLFFHTCETSAPWVFPHGYLAVDFFFLLSGFVIAYAYEDRLANGLASQEFMRARIIRLYPLVVAGALIGLIGFSRAYEPKALAAIFLSGLFLLPTPFAPRSEQFMAMPVNPPSWSLFFEISINFIFARAAPWLGRIGLSVIVALSAIALLTEIGYFGSANIGASWHDFWAGSFRVSFSFFCGVGLFRLWRTGPFRYAEVLSAPYELPSEGAARRSDPEIAARTLAVHSRVAGWLDFARRDGRAFSRAHRIYVPFSLLALGLMLILSAPRSLDFNRLYDAAAILLAFPTIVACGAKIAISGRTSAFCKLLGEISYPAYVLQGGLAPHIRDLPAKFGLSGLPAFAVISTLVVAYLVFCWMILKRYDEPIRRLLSKLTSARAGPVRRPQQAI